MAHGDRQAEDVAAQGRVDISSKRFPEAVGPGHSAHAGTDQRTMEDDPSRLSSQGTLRSHLTGEQPIMGRHGAPHAEPLGDRLAGWG